MSYQENNQFTTLAHAVDTLAAEGYTDELQLTDDGFFDKKGRSLSPEDFTMDAFHRFEGPSDPADMSIVYAVSSEKLGLKGLLVNAFGTYASGVVQRMVSKLDAHSEERHVQPVHSVPHGGSIKL